MAEYTNKLAEVDEPPPGPYGGPIPPGDQPRPFTGLDFGFLAPAPGPGATRVANSTPSTTTRELADGSTEHTTVDDGYVSTHVEHPAGGTTDTWTDRDGVHHERHVRADGTWSETSTYPNGGRSVTDDFGDGNTVARDYDAQGNLLGESRVRPDGSYTEWADGPEGSGVYDERADGSGLLRETTSDGEVEQRFGPRSQAAGASDGPTAGTPDGPEPAG